MYIPSVFEERGLGFNKQVVQENAFATLVTDTGAGLFIDHVPTLLANPPDELRIRFRVAMRNPQAARLASAREVCLVFAGPYGYVSPTWYSSHPSVPNVEFRQELLGEIQGFQ